MFKIILTLIAIPIVLILAAALLIPLFLDEEVLLAMAADSLREQTGAILVVDGGINLSVIPNLSIQVKQASLTMPNEEELKVTLNSMDIGVQLMPLFSRKVEVGELAIDGLKMRVQSPPEQPALDTSKLSNEQLDEFYAKRREALEQAGKLAGSEAVVAVPLALNVERLVVSNSLFELVAADTGEVTKFEILQLEAAGLNLEGGTMPLSAKFRLMSGTGATPIDLAIDGKIQVNAAQQQLLVEELAVEVSGALAQTINATASGVVDLSRQAADLQVGLLLAGGEVRGEGKLRYASFESPQIDAKLHFNQFDPALLALAGPDAAASAKPAPEASSTDGDQPLPLDAIRAIDTRAELTIDEVNLAGHLITEVRAKLRAVDGIVKLSPFTGKAHGGKLKMNISFNAQHNPAKFFSKGELAGCSVASALEAMESAPIASGMVDMNWHLKSKGSTQNELLGAMNGPIELLTNNMVLEGIAVEKMLCEAVAMTNQESLTTAFPKVTKFTDLSASLKMNKGRLQLQPLRAELAHLKLTGKGGLDILSQDFKLTLTAKLSPELEQLDPACRLNKRITGIGWPVTCKGQLSGDPADWCKVDSEKIIEDIARGEIERQVEKKASKFLDKLFK